jgi:hypothetical protein
MEWLLREMGPMGYEGVAQKLGLTGDQKRRWMREIMDNFVDLLEVIKAD